MFLYQVFLLIALTLWLYILWTRRKYYLLMRKIPGPKGYPLVGCLFSLKLDTHNVLQTMETIHEEVGDIFYTFLGPPPLVVASEPQIVQDILVSPHCVNKSIIYNEVTKVTGAGLFTLKEPLWSKHRKLLSPSFSEKILRSFIPTFNEHVDGLIKFFATIAEHQEIDIYPEIHVLTLSITERTLMDMKGPTENVKYNNRELVHHFDNLMENIMAAITLPWMGLDVVKRVKGLYKPFKQAANIVNEFLDDAIAEKLKESTTISEGASANKNMLINRAIDLCLSGKFNLKDVKSEVYVTTAAAFDTTANVMFYTIMLLAMFPEYQERVFEELKSLFPHKNMPLIDNEMTKGMIFLDMVINETMRLIAPVPLVARCAMQDIHLSNGIVLPKGMELGINIFRMHRRKDIWGSRAHTFYPEHFLPSNLEGKHPYAFIPFTKGIRNCIGSRYATLSLKISLAKLLRNYRFSTKAKFEDLEYVASVSIKLKKFPLFEIHKRTN